MKYTIFALAAVAIASSSLSDHRHAVRAAIPRLYKRAEAYTAAIPCVTDVLRGVEFNEGCKKLFASGDIKSVTSITLGALDLDFTDPDPLKVTISSPDMKVGVIAFPGLSIPITHTRQNVILVDNNVEIATFETPWVPGTMSGNTLTTTVGTSVVNVKPDKTKEFSAFITALTVNPAHTFILRGTVEVNITVSVATLAGPFAAPFAGALGKFTPSASRVIPGIAFSSEVTLSGFDSFKKITYIKEESHINDPTDGSFSITSNINIYNPSQLSVKMGDINFNTLDGVSNEVIGITTFKQLTLVHGDNPVTVVTSSMNVVSPDIYKRVYDNGETFLFEGFATSSEGDAILSAGIAPLKTSCLIPPLKQFDTDAGPVDGPADGPV
ncbi:hypothetical protein EC991_009189 [Linnemannia zychae]|nr:hypothetical protein EC991_009189 [Linnemannia zychae]